jgi:hypothetical protein
MLISDIIHIMYGFIGAMLNYEYLFTTIYMIYQVVDYYHNRDFEEIKKDIIEYIVGLTLGVIVKHLLFSN